VHAGVFGKMEHLLTLSRCVVVVLCPTFVADYNVNWHLLENLITNIDVVYVFYGEPDVTKLGPAIRASIKNSRCLRWSWPLEDDDGAKLSPTDRHRIACFWRHLKLAIPNSRRITADDAAKPAAAPAAAAAAAAAMPRQESADSTDSSADVSATEVFSAPLKSFQRH